MVNTNNNGNPDLEFDRIAVDIMEESHHAMAHNFMNERPIQQNQ